MGKKRKEHKPRSKPTMLHDHATYTWRMTPLAAWTTSRVKEMTP